MSLLKELDQLLDDSLEHMQKIKLANNNVQKPRLTKEQEDTMLCALDGMIEETMKSQHRGIEVSKVKVKQEK